LPVKPAIVNTFFWNLHTLAIIVAAYLGATDEEAGLGLMFAWILGNAIWACTCCARLDGFSARLGIGRKMANQYRTASVVVFVGVEAWLCCIKNRFVSIIVLWQLVEFVYEEMGNS
jgi:hypothetical protein